VQFRYGFITDDDGLKIVDVTEPTRPVLIPRATVRLNHAGRLYVARTYAYVANGAEDWRLSILKIRSVRLSIKSSTQTRVERYPRGANRSVNASQFALVADGKNGLRVVQLISPDTVPGAQGFSPRPNPKLIATYHTKGEAICVSRGLERDRVVDETGGQTVVFGRRGSRPFHLDEMERFYRRSTFAEDKDVDLRRKGELYRVEDVTLSGGVLTTKSGALLTPLPMPTPQPMILPQSRKSSRRQFRHRAKFLGSARVSSGSCRSFGVLAETDFR